MWQQQQKIPPYFIINGDKIDNKEDIEICKQIQPFLPKYWSNPLCKYSSTQKYNYKTFLKERIAFSFQFSSIKQGIVFKIINKTN